MSDGRALCLSIVFIPFLYLCRLIMLFGAAQYSMDCIHLPIRRRGPTRTGLTTCYALCTRDRRVWCSSYSTFCSFFGNTRHGFGAYFLFHISCQLCIFVFLYSCLCLGFLINSCFYYFLFHCFLCSLFMPGVQGKRVGKSNTIMGPHKSGVAGNRETQ